MSQFELRNAYLFSHGIGFFLFEKEVKNIEQENNIKSFEMRIKKSYINDVLNSFMVFTSAGSISSISYSSDVKETIKDKYLQNNDYFNYLIKNFYGRKVKLSLSNELSSIEGFLIGGENYNSSFKKKKNIVENYLVLYSANSLSQVPFNLISNVEILDGSVTQDLNKALKVNTERDEEETTLTIYYEPQILEGSFKAIIGYAIPIPLWKINYRISIENSGSFAFLDCYCLLTNPLKEDWVNTKISLITGRPVSFTYNINRSDKLERPIISPESISAVEPMRSSSPTREMGISKSSKGKTSRNDDVNQLFKNNLDEVKTSLVKQSAFNSLRTNLLSTVSKLIDKDQSELENEKITEAFKRISPSETFEKMNLGQEYEFHIKDTKTIKGKENAVIPLFLNLKLNCKKILYLDYSTISNNPYTSIELFNEAAYPFESGPCVVFENDSPVGEAILPTCFTSQSRIISYSKETRVTIRASKKSKEKYESTYKFIKKPLIVVQSSTSYQTITFEINSDLHEPSEEQPVLLIFDFRHPQNWELDISYMDEFSDIKPQILELGYRFTIVIKKKGKINYIVKFKHEFTNERSMVNISKAYYSLFQEDITDDEIKEKFEKNFKIRDEIAKLRIMMDNLNTDKKQLEAHIGRIRNNLKSIPDIGGNKIRNNFVIRLNSYDDEIAKINKEIDSIKDQMTERNQKLEELK